jgi:uncharacterized protein YecT (DUF1311 family)
MMKQASWTKVVLCGLPLAVLSTNAADNDCADASTQREMAQCAHNEWQIAESELQGLLELNLERASEAQAELLRNAHKAWENYRDRNCEFQASGVKGGSAYPMVVAFCKASMTKDRVRELESQVECEEGDLSCPIH